MALFRGGRLAEAEAAFRALLETEPHNATALHSLGFILATTGRRAEGLALLDRSIEAEPDNCEFLDNRAQVLMQAGRDEEAQRDLERAVAIDPRSLAAWLHLAQVRRRRGAVDAAMQATITALALDPEHPGVLYHEGVLHLERGDHRAAEASFRRVLQQEPRHVAALNNLGVVLRNTGRGDEALASFQRAAALDPGNPDALNNLGLALHQEGKSLDAIRMFKRALQIRPGFGQVLLNWGNALRDGGDLEGARRRYVEALDANPGFVEALVNHASVLLESERPDEARALYERAASTRPGYAEAQAGLAQVQLREQRFDSAWENYERRFDTDPPAARKRVLPMPLLVPENLARARRVAVWMEQGVGDQILFSTLLPELGRRGIEAVVEVDPRLAGLYRRGLPDVTFVSPAESDAAFAGCDFHAALGSLPRLFRRSAASFSSQPDSILRADPARVAAYRAQIGPGPAIAIAWRSLHKGNRRALGERKSIPLEPFARLAQDTGARLVDLQYGDVSEERLAFEARHPGVLLRIEGLDAFADLEGLGAALVACGRLVSSSNVTAHLAGALGVATQLLYLRGWAPFSYWVPGPGSRSLWYPSVAVPRAAWERWEEAFEALQIRAK